MDDQRDAPKPETPRRIEILTGEGVRWHWSAALKAKIVAESFAPGAVVAELARRHGTRSSQIHLWRKQAREGRWTLPAASGGAFAEVMVTPPPAPASKAPRVTGAPIEITADHIHVRVRDGADAGLVHALVRALKS